MELNYWTTSWCVERKDCIHLVLEVVLRVKYRENTSLFSFFDFKINFLVCIQNEFYCNKLIYICIVYAVFLFILITTLPRSPLPSLFNSPPLLSCCIWMCIYLSAESQTLCGRKRWYFISPLPFPVQSPSFMPCIYNLDSTYGRKHSICLSLPLVQSNLQS